LETDKAVVEVPSSHAGKITEVLVAEGDRVAIDAVIMVLESSGGDEEVEAPEIASEDIPAPVVEAEPVSTVVTEQVEPAEPQASSTPPRDEPQVDLSTVRRNDLVAPAAPSVRRLARDLGVDIYQVQGTGPGGRISEDDVRNFVRETMQRITGGGSVPSVVGEFPGLHAQRPLPDFSRWGAIRREPLSRVRELTADSMGYAWSTIPMVTQYDNAQITEVEAFRQKTNQRASAENRLTMTAIMVKVCAAALKAFPGVNSSLDLANKELVLKDYVHIGVAVDTPGGLLVPVIRDADQKGIEQLATELNGLAEKTRERKISPADMEGGTFTISNLGGVGGTSFTPIVYAPQVAILGISTAAMQPVWDGNQFVPQLIMPLSLTYDHRVVDGADGARFLRWICEALENPLNLVMKG
jgi:pyruvate dehydrogenase E2 component (dihydrolipoamide acetyltransferase)